ALGMPLCHPRGSAGTAGRSIDRLVAVKYRISSCGCGVECCPRPLDMAQSVDVFIFRMHERVLVAESITQYPAPTNQLVGQVMFQSLEVRLGVDNGIEISAIRYIDG